MTDFENQVRRELEQQLRRPMTPQEKDLLERASSAARAVRPEPTPTGAELPTS
jgi:hypothetical protein